jgi:ACS family hexuronate transporter-like MFS transporter
MTLPADLFPSQLVGSAAGLVGFGGAMCGVLFKLLIGRVLDHYGLESSAAPLHILAFLLILSMVRRIERIAG